MIDIHAHVIPGVDDGPKDMEGAIALLRQAHLAGVTQVVATPHFHLPSFDNLKTRIQFDALKEAVLKAKIPIALHLGNEVYADDAVNFHLESGQIHTLGGTNYLLLELPTTKLYPSHHDLIFRLQLQGYRVILAHVDRYDYFREKPDTLKRLVDGGCLAQISAEFVVQNPRRARRWLKAGYVHFVASDMHCQKRRPNRMDIAKKQIQKHLGEQWVHQLFIENPTAVLQQREVLRMPTRDLKRNWLHSIIG